MQIQCIQCGASFSARPSAIKTGKKFCTVRCRADAVLAAHRSETWPPITPSALHRFWSRIERGDDCWEWTGTREHYGHGCLKVGNYAWKAHRLSWTLHHGPVPDGAFVLHRCDNPPCVRPDHLFLGTQADNVRDMIEKGRAKHTPRPGGANSYDKLSVSDVLEIRRRYAEGNIRQRDLGNDFGVSQTEISRIVRGTRWAATSGERSQRGHR